jgi:transcriptional regulator with XRE-family HTH domain
LEADLQSLEVIDIDKKATGKLIKGLCQKRGLTQMQLANLLDREKKTVSNYYCGETLPRLVDFPKLSWILGKSIDELLVLKGDIKDYKWEDICVIDDNGNKEKKLSKSNLSNQERTLKAWAKIGIYLAAIDREKNIYKYGSEGYYWTEVHDIVALPGLKEQAIYDFIEARNEYELLSGEEFETDESYQIDLGQILCSYLIKETELLSKKNILLKRERTM